MKKISIFFLILTLLLPLMAINISAEESEEVLVFFIDGENVTRWADTSVVYRNKPTTEQNEWGHNVVVDASGKVIKLIELGDLAGKNLAIPDGGMVVSASGGDIGEKLKWLQDNIEVGDYVYYDSVSSRILVSKSGDFSPFYSVEHTITGFNQPRLSNTFIIYNTSGSTTKTNGYGYEAVVNSEGIIISAGGNDNTIPEGGFVISAIEKSDKEFLKMYGIVGASATISTDKKTLTLSYDAKNIQSTIQLKADELNKKLETAKAEYKLIDYKSLEDKVADYTSLEDINNITLQERNKILEEIDLLSYNICELPAVELRGIWHESVETTVSQVEKVVSDLKDAGINQLNLGITSGYNTIIPLPDTFPFQQKATLRGTDILEAYVEECEKAGIELIVSVAIFRNSAGDSTPKPEWLTKSNGANDDNDESQYFFNPANSEFREYMKSYLNYILENYEIDGLQLDYIRYPAAANGIDYGYDELTKSKFAEEYNVEESVVDEIATQQNKHTMWNQWVEFKAGLVTSFVKEIRELVTSLRPDIYLSAAVASDTQLYMYCQNTEKWLEDGLLDAIYPMTYGEGVLSGRLDTFKGFTKDSAYLFMGSGSYLTLSDAETYKQTIDSRYNADGVAFFEYFSYFAHGYADFLRQNAFIQSALSPTLDATQAAKAQIDYAIERINEVIIPFNGISQEKATKIIDTLNTLKEDITLEKTDAAIETIHSEIENSDCENTLKADLSKLKKIVSLSKDEAKAAYPGVIKDESTEESDVESVATQSDVSNAESKKPNNLLPVFLAIGAAIICCGAVLISRKKKKNDK